MQAQNKVSNTSFNNENELTLTQDKIRLALMLVYLRLSMSTKAKDKTSPNCHFSLTNDVTRVTVSTGSSMT